MSGRSKQHVSIEGLERRALCAVGFLDVTIGTSQPRAVSFVDADGTAGSVSVRGASAVVRFTGEGLPQAPVGGDLVVSGTGILLDSVTATGTSRRTVLTFDVSGGGDGRLSVGQIVADGAVKRIDGDDVVLVGALSAVGAVRQLELLRAENATISLGGAGRETSSVAIHEAAVDTDLTSTAALRRVRLASWGGLDLGDAITAPSIGNITAAEFKGDINTGSIRSLDVGDIRDTTISVSGSLRVMKVHRAHSLWTNVAGDIGAASFNFMTDTRIYAGVGALPEGSLPASVSDFSAASTIGRFVLMNSDASPRSVVAARFVSNLRLKSVNASWDTGTIVVADRIRRRTATFVDHLSQPVRLGALDDGQRFLGSVELRAL